MMEASTYPFDWILDIAEFILLWRGDVDKYENHYNGYLQRNGPPNDQTFPIPDWWCNVPNCGSTTGLSRLFIPLMVILSEIRKILLIWQISQKLLKK